MAISPKDLKGDLALELDAERLSPRDFIGAMEAFIGLIREITRDINKKLPRDAWSVSVQEGSQVLNISPDFNKLPESAAREIEAALLNGVDIIEKSAQQPDHYSEAALKHIRSLGAISSVDDKTIPIRLLSRKAAKHVTRKSYNHVCQILDWENEDQGSVDGTLLVISAQNGVEFRIEEPIWGKSVRCVVSEELLDKALTAFRHRVEVTGTIRYNRAGIPVVVKATGLTVFPPPEDLPSYREVRGILGSE